MYTIWAKRPEEEGFTKLATLTQIGGTLVIDSLLALVVMRSRDDVGPTALLEVRSNLGVVLWSIGP